MIEGTLPFDLNKTINKIPVDNKIIPYLSSSRIYLIRNHYKFGKNLITISIIFAFLLILQLFSVNIYYIKFLPKFSLDQFVFLGIFSKFLTSVSIIFAFLLILQLFSVNIYYIKFIPKFSLDQFVFLGIFSIIFYILGVRLKHKKKEKEAETI